MPSAAVLSSRTAAEPASAAIALPPTLQVIERGWLSSNSVLGIDGDAATLIDSGYVTHAEQTVALVRAALAGRRLERLFNTHAHSDHIGGNAALVEAFGCRVSVPVGVAATIAEWDEEALLLSPLGQQAARFTHNATLAAGDEFVCGELNWRALAVPGHDEDALAFHCAEKRILISGDALWQAGFGVVFVELLGHSEERGGLKEQRETLDMLARLPVDLVIPGHGAPFTDIGAAFERAYRRLEAFENNIDALARHALKVIVAFALLERRRIRSADLPAFLASLSFAQSVNARFLGLSDEALADWLVRDLRRAGALREEDGWVVAG
ncbi:MBL fold metallo-hydrolase [Rhodocyclus tenuis]|uniref:Glyoxylase-like metal-dependent hydrolase (Beta-lactamase superfamily II) n=1 Tax=Rhodocyclus tenuis TaxID=1066 RepID=A0A840G740_RHOTE|nr:MBL fold metallo-hydrolase [Rhodocyclus tenuis]MBB4246518.1 glyoxylase-like metal-dependent hydrolase (beta-lactamase superfamily II) [Rhodocyclus tenuis]